MSNMRSNTEEYDVKFWITGADGFRKQMVERVKIHENPTTKDKHLEAERFIIKKHWDFNPEIINVTYI